MKKLLLTVSLSFLCIVWAQKGEAKGIIVYHTGEHISKVASLPEDVEINGTHVDVGVLHNQFGLFWMPVWNYGDVKYVLYNKKDSIYWDMDADDLAYVNENFGLKLSDTAMIPFLSRVGLKPVLLLLTVWIIWVAVRKKDEEVAEAVDTDNK